MPWYRKQGKIQTAITDQEFFSGMQQGELFKKPKHRGYVALLYYTAVRKTEGLRAKKEQFQLAQNVIIFSVGKRLKHGIDTPPLHIPLEAPFASEIWKAVEDTEDGKRVWPYSAMTGYNIVSRVFKYPHLFRLSRITNFFAEGWTIAQVHSWTGLTLKALDFYIGIVDVQKMGESLNKNSIKSLS
jgi:integrase